MTGSRPQIEATQRLDFRAACQLNSRAIRPSPMTSRLSGNRPLWPHASGMDSSCLAYDVCRGWCKSEP